MARIDYTAMSPADLLAVVARDGVDCEAARVATSLMRPTQPPPALRCSADVYAKLRHEFVAADTERFVVVGVDARNRVIGIVEIVHGSLSSCMVHPREVFRALITMRKGARACILAHNHPSGDPTPSPDDERLTERLVDAGKLIGIPVLDHLVIGSEGYCSFRDCGRIASGEVLP